MWAQLLGGFIAILMGVSLLQPMAQFMSQSANQSDMKDIAPWTSTAMSLIPVVFAIVLMMVAVGTVISAFNNAGLLDEPNYNNDYDKLEPEEKHEQTYEEYVRERLNVEKMMKK